MKSRDPLTPAYSEAWHSVTTEHFILYTDLNERTALEAARELETTRDALISAAWPNFHFPELARTRVYVLANGLDFERIFGRKVDGRFSAGPPPAFFLYGPPSHWSTRWSLKQEAPSSVLRHEMTHQLAAAVFPREPRWFAEGIAQFLETIHVSDDGKSVVVGENNAEGRARFLRFRAATLKETLAWHGSDEELSEIEVHGRYGTSWVLFHWLFYNQPEAFSRYQLALAEGVDPSAAWRNAFPSFDADAVEKQLFEYVHHGQFEALTVPLRKSATHPISKPLTAADLHAARARMAFVVAASVNDGDPHAAEGKREVNLALALDPTNVDALDLDTWSPSSVRLELARKAAEAHPDDSRAFELLGDVEPKRPDRESAYRRALALSPDDANVLAKLASLLVEDHRRSEALPYALRAVKRAPYRVDFNTNYAELLFDAQRCEGAIDHETRAVELAGERSATLRDQLSRRLAAMKSKCGDQRQARSEPADVQAYTAEAAPAPAEAPEPSTTSTAAPAKHTGVYATIGGGIGYTAGTWQVPTKVDGSFTALTLSADVALGYGLVPGLAVGLEAGIFILPGFDMNASIDDYPFTASLIAERLGATVELYPLGSSGFHLKGGVDFMRGSWGSTGNFGDWEPETGYFAYLGAGMLWPLHGGGDIGPGLRIYHGQIQGDVGNAVLGGAVVTLNVVWF